MHINYRYINSTRGTFFLKFFNSPWVCWAFAQLPEPSAGAFLLPCEPAHVWVRVKEFLRWINGCKELVQKKADCNSDKGSFPMKSSDQNVHTKKSTHSSQNQMLAHTFAKSHDSELKNRTKESWLGESSWCGELNWCCPFTNQMPWQNQKKRKKRELTAARKNSHTDTTTKAWVAEYGNSHLACEKIQGT